MMKGNWQYRSSPLRTSLTVQVFCPYVLDMVMTEHNRSKYILLIFKVPSGFARCEHLSSLGLCLGPTAHWLRQGLSENRFHVSWARKTEEASPATGDWPHLPQRQWHPPQKPLNKEDWQKSAYQLHKKADRWTHLKVPVNLTAMPLRHVLWGISCDMATMSPELIHGQFLKRSIHF